MTLKDILTKVSEKTGISERIVERTYKSYWKVIKEYISSLPLKEDLSDDDFKKLRPNVNIPSIGKFNITLARYRSMKEKFKIRNKNRQEENAARNKD